MGNVWTTGEGFETTPANVHEVDPISRIEGHLGVKVVVSSVTGKIVDANAHGNLWRGFENFLLGRDVNDAITFTQRICGVCPVPHGMTSTYAVDNVLGYSKGHITFKTAVESGRTYGVPEKAVLIRNMVLGAEFLMSSITHFYHLAAPSYIQGPAIPPWTPFFDNSYYHAVLLNNDGTGGVPGAGPKALPNLDAPKLWDAVIYSYVKALKIRRMTFEAGALFAGRMPMTSCYVGGGVSNDGTEDLTARANAFKNIISTVALFVVQEYVPIALALGALYPAFDNVGNAPGVGGSGAGLGRFIAWGGFPNLGDTLTLPGGVFEATHAYVAPGVMPSENVLNFRVLNKADVYAKFLTGGTYSVPANLTEDIAHSRYDIAPADTAAYTGTKAYPGAVARTMPKRLNGYSYMKAPRWNGQACEVGPLARMAVAGLYPVDGTTALAGNFPGYVEIYTTAVPGAHVNGIDVRPGVIAAPIVAGLIADGIAGVATAYIVGIKGGLSTMDRLRARALESLVICQALLGPAAKNDVAGTVSFTGGGWVDQLIARTGGAFDTANSTWRARPGTTAYYNPFGTNQGWGGTEAPRGALMHQTTIRNGKIQKYQCIVPTTWNGSPKDTAGNPGAIEQAMIGAAFSSAVTTFKKQAHTVATPVNGSAAGGVEVLRIAQSFDPCIACAVH